MKSDFSEGAAKPGGGRRRRLWSSDEKRKMVLESTAPGASVAEVARRYGVNANLLFTWRRQAPKEDSTQSVVPIEFVPVRVAPGTDCPVAVGSGSSNSGRMEILLQDGARIVVGADVDAAALTRVVKALSRAGRAGLA
jgi:transposase